MTQSITKTARVVDLLNLLNEIPVVEHSISGEEVEYILVEYSDDVYVTLDAVARGVVELGISTPGLTEEDLKKNVLENIKSTMEDGHIDLSSVIYGDLFIHADPEVWWQKDIGFYIPEWEAMQLSVDKTNELLYVNPTGLKWLANVQTLTPLERAKLILDFDYKVTLADESSEKEATSADKRHNSKYYGLERLLLGSEGKKRQADLVVALLEGYAIKPAVVTSVIAYDKMVAELRTLRFQISNTGETESAIKAVNKWLSNNLLFREPEVSDLSERSIAIAIVQFLNEELRLELKTNEEGLIND